MAADQKKVQTLLNRGGKVAQKIADGADELDALVVLFNTANPSVVGTPLEGNKAAALAWVTAVRTLADDPMTANLISWIVPGHSEDAL